MFSGIKKMLASPSCSQESRKKLLRLEEVAGKNKEATEALVKTIDKGLGKGAADCVQDTGRRREDRPAS